MENTKQYKADKVLTVYHNADTDGIMSAILAIRAKKLVMKNKSINYIDNFDWSIIGYNYGKKIEKDPWLALVDSENNLLYNYIQFVDITPPLEYLKKCLPYLISGELSIDIFDHHANVYTDINELFEKEIYQMKYSISFNYYYNNKYSGAFIYWDSLFNSNWIIDRFQFLFAHKIKEENIFSNFKNSILKPLNKYNISEYGIIVKSIKQTISDDINTAEMYNLIGIVSQWDTWAWYKSKNFKALYFNEGFMKLFKVNSNENIHDLYNRIFLGNDKFNNHFLNNTIDYGEPLSAINFEISKTTKHELFSFAGWNFVAINKSANYYDTEHVKQKYYGKYLDAVVYYTTSLLNNTVNISIRSITDLVDCNKVVKMMTNGFGGGHFSAAGGQTSVNEFFNLLIEPIDETKIQHSDKPDMTNLDSL